MPDLARTEVNDVTDAWWTRYPREVTVRCRECAGAAVFESATEFVKGPRARAMRDDPGVVGVEFGRGFIRNRFPYLFPGRRRPPGFFVQYHGATGVVTCPRCVARYAHTLDWPADAYYRVEHRGRTLWAWNREYLVLLRDFIASEGRDTPGWDYFRRAVPKEFLAAKWRRELTAKIERVLAGT